MRTLGIALAAFLGSTSIAQAQITVEGIIYAQEDQQPIGGVAVFVESAQGGNLIDPWPVSVRAREDKKGILFFDEAEAVTSGKVINSETGKSEI